MWKYSNGTLRKNTKRYSHLRLEKELFQIPYQDKYILYAPLKGFVFLVNSQTINLLMDISEGKFIKKSLSNQRAISAFIKFGILSLRRRSRFRLPLKKYSNTSFAPTGVTFFLTSDCNLRCVYCYSSGGNTQKYLPWKPAKAAIDFIIDNALNINHKQIKIGFHGGGEPTLAWGALKKIVEYGKKKSAENNLDCIFSLATNGVLTAKQLTFIVKYFSHIQISLDGPSEIQNLQRPFPDGSGTFNNILQTTQMLDKHKVKYGFRATITNDSVFEMENIVNYFFHNFYPSSIHLEPLFECGRCMTTNWNAPSNEDFLKEFRKAQKISTSHGMRLFYSGGNIERISNTFCGVPTGGFTMTPEGYITACFEVSSEDDPHANLFLSGKYDSDTDKIIFDEEKRRKLARLTVENVPYCNNCFAKWHCSGDCPAKIIKLGDYFDRETSYRCEINRALILDRLIDIIEGKKGLMDSKFASFEVPFD